jgi:hypothetical protein
MEPEKKSPGNDIDVESLRLSQDFARGTEVEKLLTVIPVRKPNSQTFVRVHPGQEYQFLATILKLKEENEHFIVASELRPELFHETISCTLFLVITPEGTVSLWPNRLPGEDGRINEWHRSERIAIAEGMSHWIRVRSNLQLGGYEILRAKGNFPEPVWPQKSMGELIKIAFRGHIITDQNHLALKRLRGEQ